MGDVVLEEIREFCYAHGQFFIGSWAYPTHYWPRVIRLIASGLLPAKQVVTKRITLDTAVAEGFDALLDPAGQHLKILIDLQK